MLLTDGGLLGEAELSAAQSHLGRGLGTRGMGWMVRSSRVAMSVEKQRCVSYCA